MAKHRRKIVLHPGFHKRKRQRLQNKLLLIVFFLGVYKESFQKEWFKCGMVMVSGT